jgi:NAD(P)H-hydrate repair Nnr-like enzyme with NAD(P)H-hydrate epimerase domain
VVDAVFGAGIGRKLEGPAAETWLKQHAEDRR